MWNSICMCVSLAVCLLYVCMCVSGYVCVCGLESEGTDFRVHTHVWVTEERNRCSWTITTIDSIVLKTRLRAKCGDYQTLITPQTYILEIWKKRSRRPDTLTDCSTHLKMAYHNKKGVRLQDTGHWHHFSDNLYQICSETRFFCQEKILAT